MHPLVYSVPEAAKALGISSPTLYRIIASGEIVASKMGGRTVIRHSNLARYVECLPILIPASPEAAELARRLSGLSALRGAAS